LRLHHNTFVNNKSGEIHIPSLSQTQIKTLEIVGNVLIANSSVLPLRDESGKITLHAGNLYYRMGGGPLVYSVTTGKSYTSSDLHLWEPTAIGLQ